MDAEALLQAAAHKLEGMHRSPWRALQGDDGKRYLCRFGWPGVITVAEADTGRVVAESQPGHPFVLARTASVHSLSLVPLEGRAS